VEECERCACGVRGVRIFQHVNTPMDRRQDAAHIQAKPLHPTDKLAANDAVRAGSAALPDGIRCEKVRNGVVGDRGREEITLSVLALESAQLAELLR
jgi:hypothetical protein